MLMNASRDAQNWRFLIDLQELNDQVLLVKKESYSVEFHTEG